MSVHSSPALHERLETARRRIAKAVRSAWVCELFLVLLCTGVYVSSLNTSADSGDVLPNYFLTKSIVHSGDFYLDEYQETIDQYRNYWGFAYVEPGLPLGLLNARERLQGYRPAEEVGAGEGLRIVSAYPPGAAFAASIPYWVVSRLFPALVSQYLSPPFKAISALFVALSVACMHRALSFLARPGAALGIAVLYGFGTSAWSVASQDLWQHAPSLLLLSIFLAFYLAATALARRSLVLWATLPLALSVSCRLTNGLLLVAFLVYVRLSHPSVLRGALLLALVGMVPLVVYSVGTVGVLFSTGGYTGGYGGLPSMLSRLPEGIAGILVSPGRGLFVYTPVLAFAFAIPAWRKRRELWLMAACATAVLLSAAAWHTWWGGGGYSYRIVLEAAPFLCVLLAAAWDWLARWRLLRAAFVLSALVSCYVQVLGAYAFDYSWEQHMRSEYQLAAGLAEPVPLQPAFLWRLRDNPIFWYHRKLWMESPVPDTFGRMWGEIVRPSFGDEDVTGCCRSKGTTRIGLGWPCRARVRKGPDMTEMRI
ncbi:MAG: hypothetical protein AB8I80_21475 [Anaerolineae bacterium]